MTAPQFADISVYQSTSIDWHAYKAWSSAVDGIARVSLRSSYGTGYTDAHYHAYRSAAEAAGIQIIHYHYGYPQFNGGAAEADWQHSVVGAIGPNDVLMLDLEENVTQATAQWAYEWLTRQEANYDRLPIIYASDSYIRARLQDARIARFPLVLANWTYDPVARPTCPPPWTHYTYLQYSDKATVPGIPGAVDVNVYLGSVTTGGTVSELLNFPFVNQRTDGDINHDFDCVPSSLEAGANYLLGKSVINDAAMKDAIYGAGYIGGTAASAYVDYLKARGVKLYAINGPLSLAHQHLAAGHPVVFTRDDPYSSNPGDSHVCVWYKDTATSLTCMDPFGAQSITMTDAQWAQHLRGNEFWIMERSMTVPTGWRDDGKTLTDPNGAKVSLGFRDYILANNWDPADTLMGGEYHADSVLIHNPGPGAGQRLLTKLSELWYTAALGVRREPYLGWELDAAYKQIDALKAQLAQQQPPAPVDTTALIAAINAIPDAIAGPVAAALVEAKKL